VARGDSGWPPQEIERAEFPVHRNNIIVAKVHGGEIQLQQSVPQHGMPMGLVARRNALMNLS